MPDDDLSVVLSEPEHDLQVVHSEPAAPKASTRSNASRAIGAGLESFNPIPLLKTVGGLAIPPAISPEPAMQSLEEIGGSVLPWLGNPTPYGPQHPVLNVIHGVPFAGPPIAQIGSELSQGQYPEAGGHTAGLAAQLLLGKLFGDVVANPEARMPMPPMPSAGTVISAIRHPIRTAVVSGLKGLLGEEPEAVKAPPAPKPPSVSPVWRSSTTGVGLAPAPTEITPPPGVPNDLLDQISSQFARGKKFSKLTPTEQAHVTDLAQRVMGQEMSNRLEQVTQPIKLTPESATPNIPENAMTQGPPADIGDEVAAAHGKIGSKLRHDKDFAIAARLNSRGLNPENMTNAELNEHYSDLGYDKLGESGGKYGRPADLGRKMLIKMFKRVQGGYQGTDFTGNP